MTLRALGQSRGIRIGTAIEIGAWGSISASPAAYRSIAASEFGLIVGAWDSFMWGPTEPTQGTFTWGAGDEFVSFAQTNGQKLMADAIFCAPATYNPAWLNNASLTATQLSSILLNHINLWFTHFGASASTVLVANEVITSGAAPWAAANGPFPGQPLAALENAFTMAATARNAVGSPAKLYYNDGYGFEWDATWDAGGYFQAIYTWVADARSRGIPVEGVGFQCHMTSPVTAGVLSALGANLRSMKALGVEVMITELDVSIADTSAASLAQQATDYANVVSTALAAGVAGIITWGFTDADTWLPTKYPLVYDASYNPKPAYTAYANTLALPGAHALRALAWALDVRSAPVLANITSQAIFSAASLSPSTGSSAVATGMQVPASSFSGSVGSSSLLPGISEQAVSTSRSIGSSALGVGAGTTHALRAQAYAWDRASAPVLATVTVSASAQAVLSASGIGSAIGSVAPAVGVAVKGTGLGGSIASVAITINPAVNTFAATGIGGSPSSSSLRAGAGISAAAASASPSLVAEAVGAAFSALGISLSLDVQLALASEPVRMVLSDRSTVMVLIDESTRIALADRTTAMKLTDRSS